MTIETKESKGDESLEMIQKAKSKLATRRTFIKAASATGVVAAMYVVPKFSSVHARPAYAGITGVGVTVTKSFGELAEANWGGTGISNQFVAITNITGLAGGASVILGLQAHARFSAPPGVTAAAPGVYTAGTGTAQPSGKANGSLWNFDFFMKIDGGTFADCRFCLLYDFDPDPGTPEAELGNWSFTETLPLPVASGGLNLPLAAITKHEGSQNSLFSFLELIAPPFITAPDHVPFNPDVPGEYSFALLAKTNADVEIGRTSMKVVVEPPA